MIQFRELNAKRYYREPALENAVGFIPMFLSESDPRPAREQFDENYSHGGGWRPMSGFKRTSSGLVYPGDPPMPPLAEAHLRDETIVVFPYYIVMIVQPDGSFEVSRMD